MIETQAVIGRIRAHKLIAIVRGLPEDKLLRVADALYEGGVRAIECPFDHRREDCVSYGAAMIALLAGRAGADMDVGSGTVLTAAEARATVEAGGRFVISPNVSAEVIRETVRLGAVSMPGAMTPTEIVSAWEAGAHFVKLFPAGDLGAGYVKAVRAPLAHIPMLAVGGITPENMADFLKAGVCGFGVGSPILPKAALESGDYKAIAARARQFVEALKL